MTRMEPTLTPAAAPPDTSHLQWLAGLAMQALIVRAAGVPDTPQEREEIALWSYRMAQAMQTTEQQLQLHPKDNLS